MRSAPNGGVYSRILEHIAMHRYYMGLEQKRDISEDKAVVDWYDTVYIPIVEVVRKDDILADFPGCTESDLYLWVIDHQHYLRERCSNCDVDAEEVAIDYAEHYSERPVLRRIANAVEEFIEML